MAKTKALKKWSETERALDSGKKESKLTAACHMETVPNWPIRRPQIEAATFSDTASAPVPLTGLTPHPHTNTHTHTHHTFLQT